MANLLYANNAVGTLASAITNAQTSITLNAGQASLFPNPSAPQVFYATLTDAATQTLKEIVQVTAVSGNIFSVVRGQDGTTALSWNAGDFIEQCAIRLEMQGWENAAEGLYGATGLNTIITPSTTLGIAGTTLADNANAGSVGEFRTAQQTTGVALTSTIGANAVSISLPAGDWDVSGIVEFFPAGGATIQQAVTAVSTVSGSTGSFGQFLSQQANTTAGVTYPTPVFRVNVSSTTTVYVTASAFFASGTVAVDGFVRARRVR
jgi:hypothetical protein